MKSDIKLIFENDKSLTKFSIIFFNLITSNKHWLKNCNFHSIKNNLYIYTHGYSAIINFINNNIEKYDYKVINR